MSLSQRYQNRGHFYIILGHCTEAMFCSAYRSYAIELAMYVTDNTLLLVPLFVWTKLLRLQTVLSYKFPAGKVKVIFRVNLFMYFKFVWNTYFFLRSSIMYNALFFYETHLDRVSIVTIYYSLTNLILNTARMIVVVSQTYFSKGPCQWTCKWTDMSQCLTYHHRVAESLWQSVLTGAKSTNKSNWK